MSHAITIGDVAMVAGVVFGLLAVGGLCILLIVVMNPFRSGH